MDLHEVRTCKIAQFKIWNSWLPPDATFLRLGSYLLDVYLTTSRVYLFNEWGRQLEAKRVALGFQSCGFQLLAPSMKMSPKHYLFGFPLPAPIKRQARKIKQRQTCHGGAASNTTVKPIYSQEALRSQAVPPSASPTQSRQCKERAPKNEMLGFRHSARLPDGVPLPDVDGTPQTMLGFRHPDRKPNGATLPEVPTRPIKTTTTSEEHKTKTNLSWESC
jgi:hypothetical protein